MSLVPFFSLSPLSPDVFTYDAANPNVPFAEAYLNTYGVAMGSYGPRSLEEQYSNNKILLGYDPVPETNQTIADYNTDVYRHSVAWVQFTGLNVSLVNQYLLVFRLARVLGTPIAQFFVGSRFMRAEPLTQGSYDDIAVLLDTPGNNVWVYLIVRLAAPDVGNWHSFSFMGVDCYLL